MIVSPQGAAIICAEDAWHDFCEQQKIENPFDIKMKNLNSKCEEVIVHGIPVIRFHIDQSDNVKIKPQEIDRYNDLHDKFISAYILKLEGFNTLLKTHLKDMKDLFRPCDGIDHQCNIECKYYGRINCSSENVYPSEFKTIFDFINKDLEIE